MTPAQAVKLECRKVSPIPADPADPLADPSFYRCSAAGCMSWRWLPLMADERYLAAVAKHEAAANVTHAKAAMYVKDNRAEFGLATAPTHGYCGVDGKPEVVS